MENLVYSLEATMPVFLLMIAGMLFRRMGLFSEAFTRGANAFVFRIALPVNLFVQLSFSSPVWRSSVYGIPGLSCSAQARRF